MAIGKEEKEAVLRVLEKGILSGYVGNYVSGEPGFYGGQEIKDLENEWCKYFNAGNAVACNSATSGLWLACAAIGLKPGDECIVTPYSMSCSASMPLHFGCKPVFVDIEPDYYCIDPAKTEEKITDKTKAIIVVDLFGQPYDAEAINAIAKKHNLYVIEDAAQAIGATYKGKYAGTLGDIGVYSLNYHKHLTCGEGGIVITDDFLLSHKLRLLMNHAEAVVGDMYQVLYRQDTLVGMNMRMTELQAAIAREQLKKLDGILRRVRELAIHFPVNVRDDCKHSFYRYAYTEGESRVDDKIFGCKRGYVVPIFKLPLFRRLGYDQDQCPVCQETEREIVLAWLKDGF
jgi:dTDP-4-amino-4,6-dideoxygalactose transaminase